MAARRLAMNVIEQCAGKLEAGIKQFLISSISGDSEPAKYQIDYHEVIYGVYRCAPQILTGVAPYLTGELLVILIRWLILLLFFFSLCELDMMISISRHKVGSAVFFIIL